MNKDLRRRIKASQAGLPNSFTGKDGELSLHITSSGLSLYGNIKNNWYRFGIGQKVGAKGQVNINDKYLKQDLSLKNLDILDTISSQSNMKLKVHKDLELNPSKDLISKMSLKMKEQVSANTDTAAYGQIWVKTATPNELWFTNDAGNDIPISLQPFIKTAQFQDDIGTAQHYIPFNNLTEQSSTGTENVGFIAPFNMTLQKVVIKCSEDISGATLEVGMWAVADGATTHHHFAVNQQNVDITGGAAHTNAVADFTGIVNDGTSTGGGSNVIEAGEFVNLSIQASSDVTSSSAEFWVTCYFLADLTSTI